MRIKRKTTHLQIELTYFNKHVPEANRLMMELRREGFWFIHSLLFIKLAKLASETRLNHGTIIRTEITCKKIPS